MRYDRNHTWVSRLESSSHLFLFIFSILSDLLFELVRLALSTFSDVCIISRVPYTSGPVNECAVFVGQRTHSSCLPLRWPPAVFFAFGDRVSQTQLALERSRSQKLAIQCTSVYTFQHWQKSHSDLRIPTLLSQRTPTYTFQQGQHSALRPTQSNIGDTVRI